MNCNLYQSLGFLRKRGVTELRKVNEIDFHPISYFFAKPPVKNPKAKIFYPSLSREGVGLIRYESEEVVLTTEPMDIGELI